MPMIYPQTLIALRKARHTGQKALAEKAGIAQSTLFRIEKGEPREVQTRTVQKLALALNVSPAELANPMHAKEKASDNRAAEYDALLKQGTLTLKLTHRSRNALELVGRRYGLSTTSVVEIAPLLLLWAAEASLKRRSRILQAMREQRAGLMQIGQQAPHLGELLWSSWRAEEIEDDEARSIELRDIFGSRLDDAGSDRLESSHPFDWDEDREEADNPMVIFLRELLQDCPAEMVSWGPKDSPRYLMCREEALSIVADDEQAADAIAEGLVSLSEIPRGTRRLSPEAVRDWILDRKRQADDERDAFLAEHGLLVSKPGAA